MRESSEKLNNQAIRFAQRGEYFDAIACLKRAITVENSNFLLWFNLGITYRDAGDFKNAKDSMIRSDKLNPYDEEVIEALANLCISQRNFQEAIYYCLNGLEVNNMNPHFWNTLGVIYFNLSDYGEASELFEHAVYLNPYYYDAVFNLRDTYEELGKKVGAAECERILKTLNKDGI